MQIALCQLSGSKSILLPSFLSERGQASKEYMKDETVKIANSVNH